MIQGSKVFKMSAVSLFLVILGLGAFCFAEEGAYWVQKLSPGCLFHQWTGLKCPGCGGTRASVLLLEGQVWGALKTNFFWLPSFLVLLFLYVEGWAQALDSALYKTYGGKISQIKCLLFPLYALFTVAFTVSRNIWDF